MFIAFLTIGVIMACYPAFTSYLTEGRDTAGFLGILARLHFGTSVQIIILKLGQILLQSFCAVTGIYWFYRVTEEKHTAAWLAFAYVICPPKMSLVMGQYELIEGTELVLLPLAAVLLLWAVKNKRYLVLFAELLVAAGWLLVTRRIVPWYNKDWLLTIGSFLVLTGLGRYLKNKQSKWPDEWKWCIGIGVLVLGMMLTAWFGGRLTDVPVYLM